MLKGIDPLLSGELLKILDDMGHGDRLLVVDRNYPAFAAGRPVVRIGASSMEAVMTAILSVFPLDTFVEHPLERMAVRDDPSLVTPEQERVLDIATAAHGRPLAFKVVPRHDFYRRATESFAVVHTLEPAPYSCYVVTKGVVFPMERMAPGGSTS